MWSLKNNTNTKICKTEADSDMENKLAFLKGEREGGNKLGYGTNSPTILHIK